MVQIRLRRPQAHTPDVHQLSAKGALDQRLLDPPRRRFTPPPRSAGPNDLAENVSGDGRQDLGARLLGLRFVGTQPPHAMPHTTNFGHPLGNRGCIVHSIWEREPKEATVAPTSVREIAPTSVRQIAPTRIRIAPKASVGRTDKNPRSHRRAQRDRTDERQRNRTDKQSEIAPI